MDVGERLKAKVGPLPVWPWGLLAGGLFTVWYWVSNARGGGTATDSGVVDETDGTVGTPSGDFSTVPVVPNDDPVQDENTNAEWLVQALNAAGTVGVSFLTAQIALQKYLNGQTLTSTEAGIINKIVGVVGPPPEGTFGTPEVKPPGPKPEDPKPETSDTSVRIKAATTRKFGQALPIQVNVYWRSKGTRLTNPRGSVIITIDGKRAAQLPLINGGAIYVAMPTRGWDSVSDKRWIIGARFVPSGKDAKPSAADPHLVTLTLS
jgi:hypothetical protein